MEYGGTAMARVLRQLIRFFVRREKEQVARPLSSRSDRHELRRRLAMAKAQARDYEAVG
jgi:hypothetical protein